MAQLLATQSSASIQSQATHSRRLLICSHLQLLYSIELGSVSSIVRNPELQPALEDFPHSDGTHWTATGPVPVFRLAKALGQGRPDIDPSPKIETLIILSTAKGKLALEGGVPVREVVTSGPTLVSLPEGFANPLFTAVHVLSDESIVPHLDAEVLLGGRPTTADKPDFASVVVPMAIQSASGTGLLVSDSVTAQGSQVAFGLSFRQIVEVFTAPAYTYVPSDSIVGVLNWRGLPIPILSLNPHANLPPFEGNGMDRVVIAILPRKSGFVAIPLGKNCQGITLPMEDGTPVVALNDPKWLSPVLRGAYRLGQKVILIPDLVALVQEVQRKQT